MIQIYQGAQHDGYTFELDPRSARKLREGEHHPLPRVFIALEQAGDFQRIRGDLYEQVAQLLTQISAKEMERLGGFEIVDPVTDKVLFGPRNAKRKALHRT